MLNSDINNLGGGLLYLTGQNMETHQIPVPLDCPWLESSCCSDNDGGMQASGCANGVWLPCSLSPVC